MQHKQRPNILFLFSDQQRWDAIGVNNPLIKTPHLDRLAHEGMTFDRAYPPTPVCLPCRASLVTGQYPSTHGATNNHSSLPENYETRLADVLNNAGYMTHFIGKSHLSSCHDPCSRESAPFIHNRDYYRAWHGPWYGFQRADLAIGHTTEKHACGMHYGAWLEDQGVDTAKYFGNTGYTDYGKWDLPEKFHSSKWIADTAIASIQSSAESEQPFYIWANFQDPHNPCMVPEPWASMYDPAEVPYYTYHPGEPESFKTKPPHYQEITEQPGEYAAKPSDHELEGAGNVCHLEWNEKRVRENTAAYYGMVSLMDHHIGRIISALEASGQLDNTLIVFSADHPDCLGDHGFWFKSLLAFEEIIRVPMIVRWPANIPADTRSKSFQNLVDLPATFCTAAGLPVPNEFEGVNQLPAWSDPAVAVRHDTVIEERPYHSGFNQRILVTDGTKCVYYANRPYGELYATAKDPQQQHNLWDNPAYRELREKMIRRILDHEMNKARPRLSDGEQFQINASAYA